MVYFNTSDATPRQAEKIKNGAHPSDVLPPTFDIDALPFQRLFREYLQDLGKADFRIQVKALAALQEFAEKFVEYALEEARFKAVRAGRGSEIWREDFVVVKRQLGEVVRWGAPTEEEMASDPFEESGSESEAQGKETGLGGGCGEGEGK